MQIQKTTNPADITQCLNLARKLPTHFTEQGLTTMTADISVHDLYVARDADQILGFITIHKKTDKVAEISWMAVDPGLHRKGIGQQLMEFTSNILKTDGYQLLEVKTLAHTVEYEPYEQTRNFYLKMGFMLLDIIVPYADWGMDNPCAIYVRVLK